MGFAAIARKARWHQIGSKICASIYQRNSMVFGESPASKLNFAVEASPAEILDSPKPLLDRVRTFGVRFSSSSSLNTFTYAFSFVFLWISFYFLKLFSIVLRGPVFPKPNPLINNPCRIQFHALSIQTVVFFFL